MSSVATSYAQPPPPPQHLGSSTVIHALPPNSSSQQLSQLSTAASSQSTASSTMSQQTPILLGSQKQPNPESRTSTPHSQETPPPLHIANSPAVSNIYTAVYSGIPVYEMNVNGVAVMRRRSDSYLNATQILKVGGVDKGRRTKILEKEIHTGEHEKVQGGYGKYQGTWIPFERGRQFCRQYLVEDVLLPLLEFDPSAPQSENTPTKEQALAARRKQIYAVASAQSSLASPSGSMSASMSAQTPVFATPLSTSTAAALTALGKATQKLPSKGQGSTQDVKPSPMPTAIGSMHESLVSFNSEAPTDVDEADEHAEQLHPRKRSRVDSDSIIEHPAAFDNDVHDHEGNSRELALEPLDANKIPNYEYSKEVMTQIFLTNETSGVSQLSVLDSVNAGNTMSSPSARVEVDVAIDELGHAALHWAAALARIQLVEDLVSRGADPRRGNYAGETALVRAVLVTNNLDQSSFPQLLDMLYPAITLADNQGRTVLHHIALTAGIKGRSGASRYYLECLLEWIVRRGPAGSRNSVGLGRFMSEVVNARDKNGDTSLNIAARVGNKSIVQQLLEVGADVSIPNRAGLRPVDFGVGTEDIVEPPPASLFKNNGPLVSSAVVQKSKDIIASMSSMLSSLDRDFQDELRTKQSTLDTMHNQLREATVSLSQSRARVDLLRKQSNHVNELHQRYRNLEHAIKEEDARFNTARGAIGERTVPENGNTTADGNLRSDEVMTDETGDVTMADLDTIDSKSDDDNAEVDADRAFRLDIVEESASELGEIGAASMSAGTSVDGNTPITPTIGATPPAESTKGYFSSTLKVVGPVPPIGVLRARIAAYRRNAVQLENLAQVLRGRSSDLEDKFRGVVARCTGVADENVDALLEGLVQAVQSDPAEVDMTRVAGFLRNVDEEA
ncbi:hypothetical protein V1512DRAFT_283554 [Lipomyces arxii]|uniref:uncharacterized protein n=1 Tax=Lipomyces arxii TaxID=56418 RepID=UPI0034CDB0CC